jgi:hypothetical protein
MRRKRKVIKKDKRAELAIKGKSLEEIFQKITIRRPRKPRREKEVLADLGIGKKQAGANFQTFIPTRGMTSPYFVPKQQDYITGAITDKTKDVKGEVEKQLSELVDKFKSGVLGLPFINSQGLPNNVGSSSSGFIADKMTGMIIEDEEANERFLKQGMQIQADKEKEKRSEAGKKGAPKGQETKKKNAEKKQQEEKKQEEPLTDVAEEEEEIIPVAFKAIPDVDITDILRFRFKPSKIDDSVERVFNKWYKNYQKAQLKDNGEYETNPGTIETDFIRDKIIGKKGLVDKYLRYKDGGVIA